MSERPDGREVTGLPGRWSFDRPPEPDPLREALRRAVRQVQRAPFVPVTAYRDPETGQPARVQRDMSPEAQQRRTFGGQDFQMIAFDELADVDPAYLDRLTRMPERERRLLMEGDWPAPEPPTSGQAIRARFEQRADDEHREMRRLREVDDMRERVGSLAVHLVQADKVKDELRAELLALYEGRASLLGVAAYGPDNAPALGGGA